MINSSILSWQNIGGQGYNKYGKGIIGPGSKEALNAAVPFHAGIPKGTIFPIKDKSLITTIDVLDRPLHVSNRWGGFGTDYKLAPGDLRMTYGYQPVEYMDKRWQKLAQKRGVDKFIDRAGSVEVDLMERSHRDAKTGAYLVGKLRKPGTTVQGVKDFDVGVTIPSKDMKAVLSTEAVKANAKPTKLTPGMLLVHDDRGTYAPLATKQFLMKNKPMNDIAKAVHSKLGEYQQVEELARAYGKKGLLPKATVEKIVTKTWETVQSGSPKIEKANKIIDSATKYAKAGLLPKENADKAIANATKIIQKWAEATKGQTTPIIKEASKKLATYNRIVQNAKKYVVEGTLSKASADRYIEKAYKIIKNYASKMA